MKPITTLLVDDHRVVREGFRCLLQNDPGIKVVAEAGNGREAVALAKKHRPDVVLMDIAMPLLNGLAATHLIMLALPQTKILILSAYSDEEYVERSVEAGACGYLMKQTSAQILTKAIREVHAGRPFFGPTIAKRFWQHSGLSAPTEGAARKSATHLTPRELEVIQLVAEGKSNKQVAAKLGITVKTAGKHRQHLMDKLGIHDTAGLTRYAIAKGIIENRIDLTME